MNIRRINHEQKAFSLGNTTLRVNIYNGMASFYIPLVSNGSGNYQVDVSLIYNTHYNEFNVLNRLIGFGNGWKMSFQSYLFKYESSYNIPSFTQDDYLFIDEEYCIHRFLKYKTLIESNSSLDVYYDTSGTGLKLYVKENTNPYIVDEYGNTYTFNNITGALISITSSINSNIKKIVTYDEEGKVISISDLRKPNKKIIFSYNENNLLSKVESTSSSIYYTLSYDNTKLLQVTKHNDIDEQLIYEFNYENNRLSRIINIETLQAIALEYDDETRVRKVKEGAVKKEYEKEVLPALVYLNDGSYVSDLNYVGGSTKVIKGFHYVMKEEYNKEVMTFSYYNAYTDITSKKNITHRYYFDIDGTCINIMEKGLDDKLYTINRINGWEVEFSDNSTSYTSTNTYINNKRAVKVTKTNNKYQINFDHLELSDFFQIFTEDVDDEHNYPNPDIVRAIHFRLTFLLSFNNTSTACKKVSFNYKNTDNNEVVVMSGIVSPTLSNVWQQVTIPFILPYNQTDVEEISLVIEMDNSTSDANDFIMIADMKIEKGNVSSSQIINTSNQTSSYLNIGNQIYYFDSEEVEVTLDNNFYLTSSDLIATYKSMFEQTIIQNKNTFDLYYCNKTKLKSVSYVSMSSQVSTNASQTDKFSISETSSNKYTTNYKSEIIDLLNKYRYTEHLSLATTYLEFTLNNDNTYTTEIKNEVQTYINDGTILQVTSDIDTYVIKSYANNGLINYEKFHDNMYNESGTSFISTSYVTTYNYDDYGNLISEIIESDEDSTLESSSVYYTYDSITPSLREKVIKVQDQANIKEITYNQNDTINKIVYKYNKKYEDGDILSINEEVSNIIEYEYNDFNNLTKLKFYDKDYNLLHENMISYNKTGNISVLKDNANTYGFLYNAKDELAEVYKNKILREKYVSYTSDNLDTHVYQLYNGVIRYITRDEFDKYGHIILSGNKESNSDTEAQVLFEYESNNNYASNLSRVTKIIDPYLNGNHTYYYNDDPLSQYVSYDSNDEFNIISYQNSNKRYYISFYDKFIYYNAIINPVSNTPKIISYSYGDNSNDNDEIPYFSYYYEYDKIGRLNRKLETNDVLQNNQELTYYSNTNLVKNLSNQTYIKTDLLHEDINISINYDNSYLNGNITKIKESGNYLSSLNPITIETLVESTTYYEYDNFNQIKKETKTNGDVLEYIYDTNTKMLKQVKKNNQVIKEYEYTSNKLTKLINNGNILNIEYDRIGNIIKLGQVNLTYNSRNLLKEYNKDNTHDYTFEYDYRGRRIKKIKNNSYVTKYYYDEETLVGEVTIDTNTNSIIRAYIYYYDALGICGIKSITKDENNDRIEKNYHLIKNSLGDITKLMVNGVVVGSYSYDAWGNVEIIEESNSDSIDIDTLYNNPFRYRGYYYDVETNLALVSSRYYSPELGRFIQPADVSSLNPQSINGLNLYTYAVNNPISFAYNSSVSNVGTAIESVNSSMNSGISNNKLGNLYSNSINIMGGLHALSSAFAFVDQWSGFLSGGLDGGLGYWGPEGFGIQSLGKYSSMVSKFGKGMIIAGSILSWGSSVYNNFNNPNYTMGEAFGASAMDAGYYTAKGVGTYYAGIGVGKAAVGLGIAAGGAAITYLGVGFAGALAIGGGVAVVVGIAGAVAIYYLGELLDYGWSELKKALFE